MKIYVVLAGTKWEASRVQRMFESEGAAYKYAGEMAAIEARHLGRTVTRSGDCFEVDRDYWAVEKT